MLCLIVGGCKFYTLEEGEPYPDPHSDGSFAGAYVAFPIEGKWMAQKFITGRGWINITEQRFDTQNQAFNFAYEYAQDPKKHYSK